MIDEVTQDLLARYLDGDLQDGEWETVESLLADSAEARQELELLQITLEALKELPELEAPAGFTDAVLTRVRDEAAPAAADDEPAEETSTPEEAVVVPLQPRRSAKRVWAPFALAAAACLMVGLFWWLGPELGGPSHEQADSSVAAPTATRALDEDALAMDEVALDEETVEMDANEGEPAAEKADALPASMDAPTMPAPPPAEDPVPMEPGIVAEPEFVEELKDAGDAVADTAGNLERLDEEEDMAADDGYVNFPDRTEDAIRADADEVREKRQTRKTAEAPSVTGGVDGSAARGVASGAATPTEVLPTTSWTLTTGDADILQVIAGKCGPAAACTWNYPSGGVRELSEGDSQQAVQLQLTYQAYGALEKALKSRGTLTVGAAPQGLRGKDKLQLTIQVSYQP